VIFIHKGTSGSGEYNCKLPFLALDSNYLADLCLLFHPQFFPFVIFSSVCFLSSKKKEKKWGITVFNKWLCVDGCLDYKLNNGFCRWML
jgi:hypothetical protein